MTATALWFGPVAAEAMTLRQDARANPGSADVPSAQRAETNSTLRHGPRMEINSRCALNADGRSALPGKAHSMNASQSPQGFLGQHFALLEFCLKVVFAPDTDPDVVIALDDIKRAADAAR